ncbi:MAG TPA: hypothetical protein VHS09_01040 [Polyangiaceae bacterium]|jgi:hypothetical protein|nr:hypothetical protein [Polyangiaceae bacterium]
MRKLLPFGVVLSTAFVATGALAQSAPPCSGLPGTIVYLESGDTQENLLKVVGRQLRDTANITLAYELTGSCGITSDMYTDASLIGGTTLDYIPSTAENPAWDPTQPEATCTVDPNGAPIQLGIAALFVETCGLGDPPAGTSLALVKGPVQAYTFVVPTASDEQAIWAEEAYYAFGFGDANKLAPWNDQELMFIRPPSKSTLVATAANILVPPNKWHGVPENASTDVVTAVASSPSPEPTIGILGAEVYDADRSAGIKTLAFRAYGQQHAFFPDSTSTSFDKQNVRDGHYTLWSPTVYITPVDAGGTPVSAAVAYLEDLVLGVEGETPPDGGAPIDGLADVVSVGLIPDCAMRVTRSADGGPLALYSPSAPCGCFFKSQIPGATPGASPSGCTACTADATCGGGKCRHGFCEGS